MLLRFLTVLSAAALLALPLANGATSPYCSCTQIFRDKDSSTHIPHTGNSRESEYCEVIDTRTCYGTPAPSTSSSCPDGGDARCNYSQACFAALTAGQACTAKFFALRFTKGKTKFGSTELLNLEKAVQKAIDAKLNPGFDKYETSTARKTEMLAMLKFYVNAEVDQGGVLVRKKTTSRYGRRRLEIEEEAIELDIIDEEEEEFIPPRGRRLLAKSSKKSTSSRKTSSSKKTYTYVKVEIQGPWASGGINQKEMEDLITKTAKKQMNCCKSVSFYKICSGHNCKSETCDEGPDCSDDSGSATVIIIIIVVLICCCCCVAAAVGAYFYMNQKNENLNQEMETHNEQNTSPRGESGAGAPTNTDTQGGPEEAI